jgi:flagellar export protein FliJ
MQNFRFSLEKVRAWRSTQVELEEALLERLFAERKRLESALASLDASKTGEERAILELSAVDGRQLAFLDRYQRHVEASKKKTQAAIADASRRIATQRARVLEARRNFQLLEKLNERRFAEWRVEFNRELEAQAGEAYLARWRRQ